MNKLNFGNRGEIGDRTVGDGDVRGRRGRKGTELVY